MSECHETFVTTLLMDWVVPSLLVVMALLVIFMVPVLTLAFWKDMKR